MSRSVRPWMFWMIRLGALLAACAAVGILLAALKVSPFDAARLLWEGSLGEPSKFGYILTSWAPLLLCCSGLILTFSCGFWNIGIEGQVIMGAVSAAFALKFFEKGENAGCIMLVALLAAIAGAVLWSIFAGMLKILGGVNEIFAGLGLNYIAGSLTVYLVLGPWKRAGIGSTSGTEPFDPRLWLRALPGLNISLTELAFAAGSAAIVWLLLARSRLGLELKASGLNIRSAFLLGVNTSRVLLIALVMNGVFAGAAGWILILGVNARHNLFPLISAGYGYIAILIVLLCNLRPFASLVAAFIFAAVSTGSLQLSLQRQLDSSLGSAILGIFAVAVILAFGMINKLKLKGGQDAN